jgi:hypothetical protein
MIRTKEGKILTGETRSADAKFFYVSIVSGENYGLLYGPLASYEEADAKVALVRQVAQNTNPSQAAFAAFGVAGTPDASRTGILNAAVDVLAIDVPKAAPKRRVRGPKRIEAYTHDAVGH